MPYCSVLQCKNDSRWKNIINGGVSYHRFPKDAAVKKVWIDATGRINWMPTKFSTICSEHFLKNNFLVCGKGLRYLKSTVVPTIKTIKFLRQEALIFSFPSIPHLREKWILATGKLNWSPARTSTICSKHFYESDFDMKNSANRYLKKEAIPKIDVVIVTSPVKDFQTAIKSTDVPDAQQTEEEPEIEECHTATNFEDETTPEQVEEIPEGKIVIARVYHYFKNEYDILKAFTGNHWEVNPLANYLQRTAEATGVNERIITMIVEDKKYSLEKEQVADQGNCDARVTEGNSNDERMDLENKSDRLKPDTLGAAGSSVGTEPSDEKQLPFPAPIQLRVCGVMKTECKIEPPDDGPPTIEDDPLKSEDSVDQEHFDITITEVKAEPQDTDMLDIEQSINSFICEVRTPLVPVHVKAEPSSPADSTQIQTSRNSIIRPSVTEIRDYPDYQPRPINKSY